MSNHQRDDEYKHYEEQCEGEDEALLKKKETLFKKDLKTFWMMAYVGVLQAGIKSEYGSLNRDPRQAANEAVQAFREEWEEK